MNLLFCVTFPRLRNDVADILQPCLSADATYDTRFTVELVERLPPNCMTDPMPPHGRSVVIDTPKPTSRHDYCGPFKLRLPTFWRYWWFVNGFTLNPSDIWWLLIPLLTGDNIPSFRIRLLRYLFTLVPPCLDSTSVRF